MRLVAMPLPPHTTWTSIYVNHKVRDEFTYPFPNLDGAAVQVWEWIMNSLILQGMWVFIHTEIDVKPCH